MMLRFLGLPPSAAPPSSPRGLQEKSEPKPLTGILSPGMWVEEGWATDPQLTLMAEGENALRCHRAPGGKGPLRKDEGSIHECLCVPTLSPRKPRRAGRACSVRPSQSLPSSQPQQSHRRVIEGVVTPRSWEPGLRRGPAATRTLGSLTRR